MSLLVCFLGFFGVGAAGAFLVGLGVEYQLGETIGLFVFLGAMVCAIAVAWKLAVRFTEPKHRGA